MTPREIDIKAKVYIEKSKTESDEKITLAYITARWAAQWFGKEHPEPLNKILGKNIEQPKKQEMTDKDMLKTITELNKMFGGSVY